MGGSDAGNQQRGDLRPLDAFRSGCNPLDVGMGAESVVEARPLEAVAVSDLDAVDAGIVERCGNRPDMVDAVLMTDRMAAVAQRHVRDVKLLFC